MSEQQPRQQRQYHKRAEDGGNREEVKGDYRGGRGAPRGGRGSYQGDRPKTAGVNPERGGAKPHYQRRKDADNEGGADHHDGERRERAPQKDVDTNSWVYKFHHGARPKFDQEPVTMDTEVPPIVEKSLRKKEPSKEEFEKKMKELDNKILHIRDKINNTSNKKKETREGGKVNGTQVSFREFLNQKIAEIRVLRDKKRDLYNHKNAIADQIKVIELEREQILKTLPLNKDLQDPAKIQLRIEELEKRYKQTSMQLQEEKKLINEIKKLQESIPNAKRVQDLRPRLDVLYGERKKLTDQINVLKPDLEDKESEIEHIRKQLDDDKDQREDVKEQLLKFDEEITLLKAELQKTFDLKDSTREEHFKNRFEYQIEQDEIKYAERIAREKLRLVEAEKVKQERISAKKAALAERPNPYLKEIETCDRLVQYCQLLKRKVGLVQTEEVIKEEQKQIINEMAREDMLKKVKDGKIQQVMSKREREEADVIRVGGKKGKKPAAEVINATPAPQKKYVEEEIDVFTNIDISLLKLFTLLKVSPPQNKEQLEPKIDELNGKLKYFVEEGEKRLKEEEEKLLAGELVEDEEESKGHHEEDYGGRGGFRGGRGGSGRGGFRGGRGGRGGYAGRSGTAATGTRNHRENEDNDVYVSSDDESTRIAGKGHQQHTAGGKRSKKEDLNLDDNNYPTL